MSNIIDSIQLSGTTYQIQGSGGGKPIEGGRGISVTTGATADTVSFDLPISAGTEVESIQEGASQATAWAAHAEGTSTASAQRSHAEGASKASGNFSHAEGEGTSATSEASHAEGYSTKANRHASHAEGMITIANGFYSHAEGANTITNNTCEHASGQWNVSSSASTDFGHSGNTLFSVGNGTADNARHNAFEIRQNGDIYCSDGTNDVKLQDTITATTANTSALGGMTILKLSQAEYDALDPNYDSNTLYVVTDS